MDIGEFEISWNKVIMSWEMHIMQFYQKRREPNLPRPKPGYDWVWYSDITPFSGHSGWLEVNFKDRMYGEYLNRVSFKL
jgi:hypothetical protein